MYIVCRYGDENKKQVLAVEPAGNMYWGLGTDTGIIVFKCPNIAMHWLHEARTKLQDPELHHLTYHIYEYQKG